MKKYIADAFIKPFMAICFCLGFGGFFVFGGFQSVTVDLERDADQVINGMLTRKHLLGLYTVSTSLKGLTEARIESRRGKASLGRPASIISGVILDAESGPTSLFWGFSSVDEKYKRQIIKKLNSYIESGNASPFSEEFTIRNVFGWFGLPFFLIGVLGVLGWPKAVVSYWRKRKDVAPTVAA